VKSLFYFAIALCAVSASADSGTPKTDRLVTKEELAASFKETFDRLVQTIQKEGANYTNGSQERADYLLKMNTATPKLINQVAEFTFNNMTRQVDFCRGLKKLYPKAKKANCFDAVMGANGLGHFDDQRDIMERLNDKEKTAQMSAAFAGKQNQDELKARRQILRAGAGGKYRGMEAREDEVQSALGYISLMLQVEELLAQNRLD